LKKRDWLNLTLWAEVVNEGYAETMTIGALKLLTVNPESRKLRQPTRFTFRTAKVAIQLPPHEGTPTPFFQALEKLSHFNHP
jgi:hypothetical protein